MPITKQRVLDYVELEWGTYAERFQRLPEDEQSKRAKRWDMKPFEICWHILAWWAEGMGIIRAIADKRPFERRKYDFDAFMKAGKYKSWDEGESWPSPRRRRNGSRPEVHAGGAFGIAASGLAARDDHPSRA
jgi:hypothetical protein